MDGENKWVCSANDLATHLEFARTSRIQSGATLQRLLVGIGDRPRHEIRVLDVGAGWGGLQSWQFASEGFNVVATEISPEFMFSADMVVADKHFERVVADGTVLPFKNGTFDIIFCKEVVHHLSNPTDILRELWRVATPGAWIALREPCSPMLADKARLREEDPAVKAGITHYYYSYLEYLKYLRAISDKVEIETGHFVKLNPKHHPILEPVQRVLWNAGAMISENLTLALFLLIFGGAVSILARRGGTYRGNIENTDRGVEPIDLKRLQGNAQQLAYYRGELVPAVFDVFRNPRLDNGA